MIYKELEKVNLKNIVIALILKLKDIKQMITTKILFTAEDRKIHNFMQTSESARVPATQSSTSSLTQCTKN